MDRAGLCLVHMVNTCIPQAVGPHQLCPHPRTTLSQLGQRISDFSLVVAPRMNEASLAHCPPLNHYAQNQFWEFASMHPVWSNVSCWGGYRVHEGPWDVTSLGMGHTWTEFGPDVLCQRKQKPCQKWKTKPQGLESLLLSLSESLTGMPAEGPGRRWALEV